MHSSPLFPVAGSYTKANAEQQTGVAENQSWPALGAGLAAITGLSLAPCLSLAP
jgi:hypothetical protein